MPSPTTTSMLGMHIEPHNVRCHRCKELKLSRTRLDSAFPSPVADTIAETFNEAQLASSCRANLLLACQELCLKETLSPDRPGRSKSPWP